MLADRRLAERAGEPGARCPRVGLGLQRGEGLGGDQDQCPRRIEVLGHGQECVAIHVGQEARLHAHVAATDGERLGGDAWAEIGTADADIHHVCETLAGCAAPVAVVHGGHEPAHAVAFGGGDFRGVLDAAGEGRLQPGVRRRAQRHVHRGAVFGYVHHLPGEQPAAEALQVGGAGEFEQGFQHFGVDGGLRVVEA